MTPVILTNLIQRFLGLAAFTLLFIQLISGAFMDKLTKKFGGRVFKFHIFEGILIYCLAVLHPLVFMTFNHFIGHGWNPYAVFINACLICNTPINFYYALGMISFWLLTLTVFMGLFRHYNLWFKANWRKFHILNYLIFLIVGVHAFLLGTDFSHKPFVYFAAPAYALVLAIVVFVEIPRLYKNFMVWVK